MSPEDFLGRVIAIEKILLHVVAELELLKTDLAKGEDHES